MEDHPTIWNKRDQWFEKLDVWVTRHVASEYQLLRTRLGGWQRTPPTQFDLRSPAYQDMVFFHPFVRRAFFDTVRSEGDQEALLHSYAIRPAEEARLLYQAEDACGSSATCEITSVVSNK
jgi:hypothetical protein